jgi:hypothetical protein
MKKGYHVAEINRSGTYLITDGGSQAWAIPAAGSAKMPLCRRLSPRSPTI